MGPRVRSLAVSLARRVSQVRARDLGNRAEAQVPVAANGFLSSSGERSRTQAEDAQSREGEPTRHELPESIAYSERVGASKAKGAPLAHLGRAPTRGGRPQASLPSAAAALRGTHAFDAHCARADLTPVPGSIGARRWLTGTPGLQQASPADKDSGGAGAGAGVGAGVGPTSAEGEGGSAEASEPTVQAWKAWISDGASKSEKAASSGSGGEPQGAAGGLPGRRNRPPEQSAREAGRAAGPVRANRAAAKGQAAEERSDADELKELERILGLDVEDAPVPLQGKGLRGKRRAGLGKGGQGRGDRQGREFLGTEEEEEGRFLGVSLEASVEQQISQLRRSGRISEAAARAIRVYDLDAPPESGGKGDEEGAGDAGPGVFAMRRDRLYYPGQFYAAEEMDFTKPLPESSVELMKRQPRTFNSKEILKGADFRNVRLLSRFLTSTGRIQPRHRTRLSAKAQRKVAREIRVARTFGLMPFTLIGQPPFRFGREYLDLSEDSDSSLASR